MRRARRGRGKLYAKRIRDVTGYSPACLACRRLEPEMLSAFVTMLLWCQSV